MSPQPEVNFLPLGATSTPTRLALPPALSISVSSGSANSANGVTRSHTLPVLLGSSPSSFRSSTWTIVTTSSMLRKSEPAPSSLTLKEILSSSSLMMLSSAGLRSLMVGGESSMSAVAEASTSLLRLPFSSKTCRVSVSPSCA